MKIEVRFGRKLYELLPREWEPRIHLWETYRDESGAIESIGLEVDVESQMIHESELPVKRLVGAGGAFCEIPHDGSSTEGFLCGQKFGGG